MRYAGRGAYKDKYYMRKALELAKKGLGNTSPNPIVGALLVKNGRILAKGYHRRSGLPHAEIEALRIAGKRAKDATLYVSLEPCSHFGKTPPCTDTIIKEGVKRVVIGMCDPNPINYGKGIAKLQRSGVEVRYGVLEKESEALNRIFKTYITQKRPYVTVKVAQSLDGKIATFTGHSRWITNKRSRIFTHRLRGKVDAVLVGVNTVIKDDPLLTSRIEGAERQPIRVILDTKLKTPKGSKLIKDKSTKTIIATGKTNFNKKKALEFRKMGIDVVSFKEDRGMIDLKSLLRYLANKEISHLLVEGGGNVIANFLNDGLVDEMFVFVSPKIIGGKDAITSVEGKGIRSISEAIKLMDIELKKFDQDILIRGHVYRDN